MLTLLTIGILEFVKTNDISLRLYELIDSRAPLKCQLSRPTRLLLPHMEHVELVSQSTRDPLLEQDERLFAGSHSLTAADGRSISPRDEMAA